ncbi:MAG: hypothetical protein L6R41_000018 [Letrouitia leprolyta]|nr:MAG: hypothetical protein L6R41_000018 [Letrouitia leprolyta]
MTAPPISLLHYNVPVIPFPMHEQQQEARDGKEDAIHDPKREARLQHCAVLIRVEMKRRSPADPIVVDGDGEVAVGGKVCAVRLGNIAKLVDAGDERANEAKVDKGDKDGRISGGFTSEDGDDGPSGSKDGNDEENTGEAL